MRMRLNKEEAGYLPPQGVPFRCGDCKWFDSKLFCELVHGMVSKNGCCNLFTAPGNRMTGKWLSAEDGFEMLEME